MLAAEEARARLLAVADEGWHDTAQARVGKLTSNLRTLAEPVLARDPREWEPNAHRERRRQLWTVAAGLDELASKQLASVMQALHPGLGDSLASWWVAAKAQPYARGWSRRAFRAPGAPGLSREQRINDLTRVVAGAGPYGRSPEWFAAWAPYLNVAHPTAPVPLEIGPVLAAAIDSGGSTGEAVFRTLVESGSGDHAIGGMGRHVIVGLLRCARRDAWEYVEAMLLAAQRQEGLRQSILEAADEAHPEAFTRILDLAVSENLIRFAATIRAVSVWFGFPESAEHIDDAARRLEMLRQFRLDRELAARRVLEGDAWDTYAGLCAIAQFDVEPALDLARRAAALPGRDNRAAALRFLANTQLPDESLLPVFAAMTADPDLAVASLAHRALSWSLPQVATDDVYQALDSLARRLPGSATTVAAVGIDPEPVPLDRGEVAATMIRVVGNRPLEPLLDLLPSMGPNARAALARAAAERRRLDGDLRRAIVKMVGDRSTFVRQRAVEAMNRLTPSTDEALELESLLTRKAGDLRRGVIGLLSRLPTDDAVASANRLWAGTEAQRDAACELLSVLDRAEVVVATAESFVRTEPSVTQRELLSAILGDEESEAADPTLGLYEVDELTPARAPKASKKGRRYTDPVSFRIAEELDDLAERHRNTTCEMVNWQGSTEVLLGDARWLPSPFHRAPQASEGGGRGMVLAEIFRTWWDDRPSDCRGESESLDALRALAASQLCADHDGAHHARRHRAEVRQILRPLVGRSRLQLRHPQVVHHVLEWVLADTADVPVIDECIEATEAALAAVPRTWIRELATLPEGWQGRERDWRINFSGSCPWMALTAGLLVRDPLLLTSDRLEQWYGLMRWFGQPIDGAPRVPVEPALLYAAHAIGAASDADVYEAFIEAAQPGRWGGRRQLLEFTRRRRDQIESRHPTVVPLADKVRERAIEIERSRGELSTAASHLAFRLGSIEGASVTLELLARLGRSTLVRGHAWNNDGREAVYSRLIQISYPAADDTAETVSELVAKHKISERRLVELAMFAPQWAPTVEEVLGWEGLEDAIWWFHAHTKDDRWSVEVEVRESWATMSAERTPLSAADLTDGAVDVAWFARAHARLGPERWAALHQAAKLASGGAGHRRAQIFAEAMLGQADETELVDRIEKKRHQDSVRALGLLPLPAHQADDVALRRYQVLRAFERGSTKFGQQRQRNESTAVRIGIENLARSTGAADPQRFIWAMEAAEAGDLADGPVTVVVDDVAVTLRVDTEGVPDITVQRGGKHLKSVPAALRKQPEIKALTDRRRALKRQASRVRGSLEDAMVRQDAFTEADFVALGRHPVVAPVLEMVIWIDDAGCTFRRHDEKWVDPAGEITKPQGAVRIAHPVDLLGTGNWIDWQERLFDDAERQPFKQAFRELYILTGAEAVDSPLSRRWSGHQLQSRQAHGLFTARGWLSDRDAGEVAKVFHHAGLVARVSFVDGWGTPAEVELPTISAVYFTKRNECLAQPLDSIPPVLFSETMRDLDLVVSVAHAGGVDPEATASTIEMRAALVRETARIMHLDNVTLRSHHVVIEGTLGEYSVHLGSGTVHRRPGGAVCIIPVEAQRRGRVFLPFADDDPKTAEVVSKVLMLARDSTIKDPTILEQLRS